MKKIFMVAMALIGASSFAFADKNEQKELNKERQEIRKLAKSELKAKVDKNTKKEAKRLAKEGWEVVTMERENRRTLLFFSREAFLFIMKKTK